MEVAWRPQVREVAFNESEFFRLHGFSLNHVFFALEGVIGSHLVPVGHGHAAGRPAVVVIVVVVINEELNAARLVEERFNLRVVGVHIVVRMKG
eukprot:6199065-Pleurochrysis_carterae.AAC.1